MPLYEVEVKSLLGTPERADALRKKLKEANPSSTLVSRHKQLNHYFEGGDIERLYELLTPFLSKTERKKFRAIVEKGEDFSVRTRLADKTLLFVVKASLDEGSSHNTVTRLEYEAEVTQMTLDQLDALIQEAGFTYQAKWSREREEYVCKDMNICLDKNAGYGYLAEFEKVVEDDTLLEQAREDICTFMDELGFEELPQDRLERMFAYYNEHWPEYYGTDKIFTIE